MSRYNRRTDRTRAGIGGTATRMAHRLDLRATARLALHEVNPPGTKMLKRFFKAKVGRRPANLVELYRWRAAYYHLMHNFKEAA